MKALTIKQPWASAIMAGIKTIENRTWPTNYTGALVIHAGLTTDSTSPEIIRDYLQCLLPLENLPYGVLLGTVEIIGCEYYNSRHTDNPFATGPWCWVLADPRPFPQPIPSKGKQGLWDVPDEIATNVEAR